MRDYSEIKELARRMTDMGVPVRVGVNSGSMHPNYKNLSEIDALVNSALDCANVFESCGHKGIVIAIKSSDTMTMIEANRKLAAICDYPLHLGVTESGTLRSGLIKSSVGIGTLLQEGIGDTIRISLTAPPVEEVKAAKVLLKTLGLRKGGADVVSCPTCSRTEIDVEKLALAVENATSHVAHPIRISVMGCPLNGIGEAEGSDLGIAGGRDKSVILRKGKIIATVSNELLMPHFMMLLDEYLDDVLSKR